MTSAELNEQTKDEWQELGFFYDYDENASCWRFVGSRQGLLKFCDILNGYASDERNAPLSEHEHFGPYWYLKLITWTEPIITPHDIRGTFEDFRRLSKLTRQKLENASVGDKVVIDVEYSSENEAKMLFEIEADDFDAAKADSLL